MNIMKLLELAIKMNREFLSIIQDSPFEVVTPRYEEIKIDVGAVCTVYEQGIPYLAVVTEVTEYTLITKIIGINWEELVL